MKTVILERGELYRRAADDICALLSEKPDCAFTFAGGRTMPPLWEELSQRVNGGRVSFARARFFQTAEFLDVPEEHTFRRQLEEQFLSKTDLNPEACFWLDSARPEACDEAIAAAVGMNNILMGAGVALIPVAITGGIHLDGLCDVADAQASHADPERKRQILKDPHLGAFAVIAVACYLIASTAIATELTPCWQVGVLLGCSHVFSRCLSGIATIVFPTSASQGMLSAFHESAEQKRVLAVLIIELVVCAVGMAAVSIPSALPMVVIGLVCLVLLYPFAKTQYGGMSGDIAGAFLQVTEIVMLVVLVIVSKVVGI